MKVVYIHQYFRNPINGGAIRSYYLAKSLVESGSEVEVVTAHNKNYYRFEKLDGINIHYLPVKYDNSFSNFKRKLSFALFFLRSYLFIAKNIKNIDLCYATSTPLTVGLTAWMLKAFKKIPFYFEVRDLWPEAPIQLGVIKNPFVKWILHKMEKSIYKNADKIIALSPGMAEGIKKLNFEDKTQIISNISDCEYFQIEEKEVKNTFYYGVGDKFVISYFGAIGKVNNIEFILSLAKQAKERNLQNLRFIIAGRGSELKRLRRFSQQHKLNNVRFIGFQNRKEIKKLLNVTDASIITFEDKPVLETNSPNKFFDSIAAGKLCIVNNKGWIKDLIESNECGFYVPPSQEQLFFEQLEPYLEDKNLLVKAQQNARKLAEQRFSRSLLTRKFVEVFNLHVTEKESTNSSDSKQVSSKVRA